MSVLVFFSSIEANFNLFYSDLLDFFFFFFVHFERKQARMSALTRLTLSAPSALGRLGQLLAHRQFLPIVSSANSWTNSQRSISTSIVRRDIDSAAKYIGAGAATVGVAGAGAGKNRSMKNKKNQNERNLFV